MNKNLTDQHLDFGYWIVTRKQQIRKTIIAILITVNVGLWGYVLFAGTMMLVNYRANKNAVSGMPRQLSYHQDYKDYNRVLEPDILSQTVVSLGEGKYDLIARAENANEVWSIPYLEYRFVWSGGETEFEKGYMMPGERKFFLGLNVESETAPSDAALELRNVKYLRITAKRALPPGSELGLTGEEARFVPAGTGGLEAGKASASSTVHFNAVNYTPYNLWSVTYKTLLYQGNRIVGASSIPVRQLLSGESRLVEMNWVQNFPQITGIAIEPEVNWLDESVFMPIQ